MRTSELIVLPPALQIYYRLISAGKMQSISAIPTRMIRLKFQLCIPNFEKALGQTNGFRIEVTAGGFSRKFKKMPIVLLFCWLNSEQNERNPRSNPIAKPFGERATIHAEMKTQELENAHPVSLL